MHKVKRAIIMAAGIGKRMQPVSLHTPKPLIKVNGVRMIDTVISGLHQNGITEIYIVVGYLKEAFAELPKQYPGVVLIENMLYETCNNISSLYAAREHLEDVIILDGDQIISLEWLLSVENGVVTHCGRNGGEHGWQLFSISRWNKEDGAKLKRHLEIEFEEKKNRQIYWDDVAMFCYPDEYKLGIHPMEYRDIIEIDNLSELVALDPSYKNYLEKQ